MHCDTLLLLTDCSLIISREIVLVSIYNSLKKDVYVSSCTS